MVPHEKTWVERHGLAYALLRLAADTRPTWARCLGLRDYEVNGEAAPELPPRLRYKRKIGSHPVNPKAEPAYVAAEETRYDNYLKDMSPRRD